MSKSQNYNTAINNGVLQVQNPAVILAPVACLAPHQGTGTWITRIDPDAWTFFTDAEGNLHKNLIAESSTR